MKKRDYPWAKESANGNLMKRVRPEVAVDSSDHCLMCREIAAGSRKNHLACRGCSILVGEGHVHVQVDAHGLCETCSSVVEDRGCLQETIHGEPMPLTIPLYGVNV